MLLGAKRLITFSGLNPCNLSSSARVLILTYAGKPAVRNCEMTSVACSSCVARSCHRGGNDDKIGLVASVVGHFKELDAGGLARCVKHRSFNDCVQSAL